MPDAFRYLLCQKLCWHNRPGPKPRRATSKTVNCNQIKSIYNLHREEYPQSRGSRYNENNNKAKNNVAVQNVIKNVTSQVTVCDIQETVGTSQHSQGAPENVERAPQYSEWQQSYSN